MKVNSKTDVHQHIFKETAKEMFTVPVWYFEHWRILLNNSVVRNNF